MKMKKQYNLLLFFILILIAAEAILFSFANYKSNQIYQKEEAAKQLIINKFSNIPVLAKAFSIYDITDQKEIFGKNQYRRLPIASLVKTLTVVTVLDDSEREKGEIIKISESDLSQIGDNGLFLNEKWNIEDLARFTLILSSNDGASALVGNDKENFVKKMEQKAEVIGMKNFSFLNCTGLDLNEASSGAYASAKDVNIMNAYAFRAYPNIFFATSLTQKEIKSLSGKFHLVKNTDLIIDKIPNIFFSKTGYTKLAGGNLSVILKDKNNHDIAITVLGSTMEGRFSDMEKLVNMLLF
jgi:D-alanyl-D-alanine carboxypeptidase (penicillin-binding protein 5/6)